MGHARGLRGAVIGLALASVVARTALAATAPGEGSSGLPSPVPSLPCLPVPGVLACPSPSPSPSPTPTPSATPTPSWTPHPSPTPQPSPSPTPTPSPTPSPTPVPSPTPTPTPPGETCLAPATLTQALPPDPNQPECPYAKTCVRYKYNTQYFKGWRKDADGKVRIQFWINPTPPSPLLDQPALTPEQIEAAVLTAASIWTAHLPAVCFLYQGRTSREPTRNDGYNDFSYGRSVSYRDESELSDDGQTRREYRVEADINRQTTGAGSWTPCEQRDNSCTRVNTQYNDIGKTLVHEMGHVLGLDDLDGVEGAEEMTMDSGGCAGSPGCRSLVTLGLGDVLGACNLYPPCPSSPQIYVP